MIVDFCRVHDDSRYHFGQVCPVHKATLCNISLTCRTMRSLAEPLLLESVELKCKKTPNMEAWERNHQLLRYLDSRPEKNPLVKYLVIEDWKALHSTILRGTALSLWIGNFTNIRGIFFASTVIPFYLFEELFRLPQIEFVELRDPVLGFGLVVVTPEMNLDSFGLRSLKIDMKNGFPGGSDALGYLACGPSLENLEYSTDRFRALNIGANPKSPHTFGKLKSFRTNEPANVTEWEQLVGFLRDIPNLRTIRLDPSGPSPIETARKEMEPIPANMLPNLCDFSGNITTAASFVGERSVFKIILLPSPGNMIEITRSSLISITATSIPLRVLHIYEVYLVPEILQQIASLFPWLEEFEWHVTDPEYTRQKPLPVGDLKPLRLLRKVRFMSIERHRGFLDSDEVGLDKFETEMVDIMGKNHPCLEVMELNRGRVWVRSRSGWTFVGSSQSVT